MVDEQEPKIDALVGRAKAILAVKAKGGGMMPENPYEVLRECVGMIEFLTGALGDTHNDLAATQHALGKASAALHAMSVPLAPLGDSRLTSPRPANCGHPMHCDWRKIHTDPDVNLWSCGQHGCPNMPRAG